MGAGLVPLLNVQLAPIFRALNIDFNATNNAMENNQCVPYDLCVSAFAGSNADMVHWEQS